jgi:Cd(II)/Pb(II)-responsive transcriptional regulator
LEPVLLKALSVRISELSRATGVSVEALRFYEQEQLLTPPQRSRANYRIYGEKHLEQVQFIRHCRSLDIAIEDIRQLLSLRLNPSQSCLSVNSLLDDKLAQLDQRIRDLQCLQVELQQLRSRCSTPATAADCGILKGLSEAAPSLPQPC